MKAEDNERACALNCAPIYNLLQDLDSTFKEVSNAVEKDNERGRVFPRFLIIRTRSSLLAGLRLAMGGQIPESYQLFRSVIEQAWYALHIAKDPSQPERENIWLCRNDSDAAKRKCQSEFSVGNVRSTHESFDLDSAKNLRFLYDKAIDFGGHPNQQATFMAMSPGYEEGH